KWDKKSKKANKDESDEIVEPVKKTRVVEFAHRTCFSLNAVPECPKKTTEDEDDRRELKTDFACFSRNSDATRLMREARREVLDLSDYTKDYSETLVVPRTCIAY
ncbi:hypothetical protein PENTCL1PPCAC_29261, partial [Pristionchus entomophagus]